MGQPAPALEREPHSSCPASFVYVGRQPALWRGCLCKAVEVGEDQVGTGTGSAWETKVTVAADTRGHPTLL